MACANQYKRLIDPAKSDDENAEAISYALNCDATPSPTSGIATVQDDRSGRRLIEQVIAADYRIALTDDATMDADVDPTVGRRNAYVEPESKRVVVRRSLLNEPDQLLASMAHEFTHVTTSDRFDALNVAFQDAFGAMWEQQAKEAEERRRWKKRSLGYKIMNRGDRPPKFVDPATQPEPKEKKSLREQQIEDEIDAFTRSRAISRQLGIPCVGGGNQIRTDPRLPRDDACKPYTYDESKEQLKRSNYASLFSPTWRNEDLYNPALPEIKPKPTRERAAAATQPAGREFAAAPSLFGGGPDDLCPPPANCALLELTQSPSHFGAESVASGAAPTADDSENAQRTVEREADQGAQDDSQADQLAADLANQQAATDAAMAAHEQAVADGAAYTETRDREAAEAAAVEAAAHDAERARQAEEDQRNQPAPPPPPESTQPQSPPYRAPDGDDSADSSDNEGEESPPVSDDTPADDANLPDPGDGWTPSEAPAPPPLQLDPAPEVDGRYAQGYTEADIYREDHQQEFATSAPPAEPVPTDVV